MGRKAGVREEQLQDLASFEDSSCFSEIEQLVLRLTVQMCKTPVDVPDALWKELRARLDEAQLVEIAATVAWENYRARFNRTFQIQAQGFSDGAYCALPEHA